MQSPEKGPNRHLALLPKSSSYEGVATGQIHGYQFEIQHTPVHHLETDINVFHFAVNIGIL